MCSALICGSTKAWLLSCCSPAIPLLAGICAFWQGKVFCPPCRCSARNTIVLPPFGARCRLADMLWPCKSTVLLTLCGLLAATYRSLLTVLLVHWHCRSLWFLIHRHYRSFWLCK